MPKGYVVANIRVKVQEKFQSFSGMARPVIQKFGGNVLARGANANRHGGSLTGVVMMIEFESKKVAEKFYFSEEYLAASVIRNECAETNLMIIEGAE